MQLPVSSATIATKPTTFAFAPRAVRVDFRMLSVLPIPTYMPLRL